MKSLSPTGGHPLLQAAFGKPAPVIIPENAPEYVRTHFIASDGAPIHPIIRRELGLNPGSRTEPRWYDAIPDMRIHELSGVLLYNGGLYSRNGGIFPESFRIFHKDYRAQGFYTHFDRATLTGIGTKHFIPQRPAEAPEPALLECEEILLPFFTLWPVYGHWLLEAVPCLWAWDEVCRLAGGRRPKLLLSPIQELPAYVKEFCRPFGITEADCFFPPASHMRLHRLFLPTRAYMHGAYVSSTAKAVWNRIASYHDAFSSLPSPEKIYLSRGRLSGYRAIRGEAACEELFARRGFTIVHPEELSLADQMRLFAEVRYIAGPVGSALHNVVFSRRPDELTILMLSPRDFGSILAFSAIEQGYGRILNVVYGSKQDKEAEYQWSLDGKNLEKAVEQWLNE